MGLFRRSNELQQNSNHHPVVDGALAGGLAHHEGTKHPARDGVLAGGVVGEVQHHRNEKAERHNAALSNEATGLGTHGSHGTHGGANPYGNGNALVGSGYGGDVAAGGAATGVSGAHTHTTHTGPAPLHGVNAATAGAGAGAPTIAQANKLERKGKMESTLGGLFCSRSMQAKSQAHLAQADHLRMQASELGEAERLENEAGMRRQRAVGLGADPMHASGQTGFAPNGARTGVVA